MFASMATVAPLPCRCRGALALLVALAFTGAGCSDQATIYIDNGSPLPMVASVDGAQGVTIAPGTFASIACPPGERRIEVRCGEDVVFHGMKDVQAYGTYLFNPDDRNRYWTYSVKYGSSRLEGVVEAAVGDPRSETQKAYQALLAEVQLLPSSPWVEVPDGVRHVLREPPEAVLTKRQMEKHKVLWRIDPSDYAKIEAAGRNQDPTEDDLTDLEEVVERVFASAP